MSFYFLGTKKDITNVLGFMEQELNFNLYEAYSRFDEPIRKITQNSDLSDFVNLQNNVHIRGWASEFNDEPEFKEIISKKPELFKKRTSLEGPALFNVVEKGFIDNGCLYPTLISFWSEKGAKQRSYWPDERLDNINWKIHRSYSRKLKRYIAIKCSAAKLGSIPIMKNAFSDFKSKKYPLWNWGEVINLGSEKIKLP